MTYVITSRQTENEESMLPKSGLPIHIKVPGRRIEDQPIVGFATKEPGKKFLSVKNLPIEDYSVLLIEEGIDAEYRRSAILVIENEQQLMDMEKESEGFDYEQHILRSAL